MASKIKMSLTIGPENVEIWCKRSGFTVITPLEILQNKQLGLKKVEEIIFSSGDGDRAKRLIRKELRKQLIYKNEEERIEIEEKVYQLCDVLIYMKENNLDINKNYGTFMSGLEISFSAPSIEELYSKFKIVVTGFCSVCEERGNYEYH